ncbi:MAG: DNA sulfur modification protein DndB [Pseudomonadales bacterium]
MADIGYNHSFPALRGTQACSEFYIAMCPMGLIPKIFRFDDEDVPPELRAQRVLNRNRVPDIANYLVENRNSYIVSALTVSVNASVRFEPLSTDEVTNSMGTLHVPMEATMLINDGQHRRAAIEDAIKENPELKHDHVPVLFFIDNGLKRSQQMFADLNKHAVRPSDSLSTLYDHRDPSSELARYVAMSVDGFKGMTEMEKSSISNRSVKLFTLSGIKHANRALLRKGKNEEISQAEMEIAAEFWTEVVANIPDWVQAKQKKVASSDLRQTCIHAHGVALAALGAAGADLLARHPKDWKKKLSALKTLDWSRSNEEQWEGRAMVLGKISKARNNVMLTANLIKEHLGLELNDRELELEAHLKNYE